jgi:hypothetical protein
MCPGTFVQHGCFDLIYTLLIYYYHHFLCTILICTYGAICFRCCKTITFFNKLSHFLRDNIMLVISLMFVQTYLLIEHLTYYMSENVYYCGPEIVATILRSSTNINNTNCYYFLCSIKCFKN